MSHPATARLFFAVDPPAGVCRELARWARAATGELRSQLGSGSALRLLEPELMHVTVCFLGNRPVGEIEQVLAALSGLGGEPVGELSLGAPLWLPRRRPRTLAIEIHDDGGGLAQLREELERALSGACDFEPERRRFRPHLTVARVRGGRSVGRWSAGERALAATPALCFTPHELVLYRSLLAPDGASYQALAERALR